MKKNSDYIIKTKDQIFAIDSNEKDIINGITSKKNINIINNDTKKENNSNIESNDKSTKNLNSLKFKRKKDKLLINKKNYILPKNKSYISLMQNSYRKDVLNNYNQISQKEEKKTNNDFINIKKLCINSKNALTKITNQTNNIELKDKFNLLRKRHNKLNKLNNIIRINNNVKNVFNINNNEINNINNNSNINIYLSINMFHKMLNNLIKIIKI